MTRVNTSSRPVELFGLAAAETAGDSPKAFEQRHHVDAAGFQHRAARQIDGMQGKLVEALGNLDAGAGQEAGAHAIRHFAEPQIEAGRLHLFFAERPAGRHFAAGDQRADRLRRQEFHRLRRVRCCRPVSVSLRPWPSRTPWSDPAVTEAPLDAKGCEAIIPPQLRGDLAGRLAAT